MDKEALMTPETWKVYAFRKSTGGWDAAPEWATHYFVKSTGESYYLDHHPGTPFPVGEMGRVERFHGDSWSIEICRRFPKEEDRIWKRPATVESTASKEITLEIKHETGGFVDEFLSEDRVAQSIVDIIKGYRKKFLKHASRKPGDRAVYERQLLRTMRVAEELESHSDEVSVGHYVKEVERTIAKGMGFPTSEFGKAFIQGTLYRRTPEGDFDMGTAKLFIGKNPTIELQNDNGEYRPLNSVTELGHRTFPEAGYERLHAIFRDAHHQAAYGKGNERHANDLPFHEQRMQSISRDFGSPVGMAYQVEKKLQEGLQMEDPGARRRELLGALNYLAGIVIFLDDELELTDD